MEVTQHTDGNLDTMGRRIRAARMATRLSVTTTANSVGISRVQLTDWEADRVAEPKLSKIMGFARLCDVNLDWLVDGRGPAPEFIKTVHRRPQKG